jgi:hypothetical protein
MTVEGARGEGGVLEVCGVEVGDDELEELLGQVFELACEVSVCSRESGGSSSSSGSGSGKGDAPGFLRGTARRARPERMRSWRASCAGGEAHLAASGGARVRAACRFVSWV